MSWSINGVSTKLEKTNVFSMLREYDVIGLNEVKTMCSVSLPGYTGYRSNEGNNGHRGGTVVLIRNSLCSQVWHVDTSIEGQVWLQLKCIPDVMFGFCYIPPLDSAYFKQELLSAIQEKVKLSFMRNGYIIMGDMNSRFGELLRELPKSVSSENGSGCTYPCIPDSTARPSDNAYVLSSICSEADLLVVNNLRVAGKHYKSNLTFRRRHEWISEIDTCLASVKLQ